MTKSVRGGSVAVMQPYLYPYAGYFRLMAAADTFVVYDDVQFPRRGRVHRCELPGDGARSRWLTLPIRRAPLETAIRDVAFADGARAALDERLRGIAWLAAARGPLAERVRAHLNGELTTPAEFAESALRLVAAALQLPVRFVRSSDLPIDPSLRGQSRVLALVEAVGGRTYVNPPNGRALYDPRLFAEHDISLRFLQPYRGRYRYLLPALVENEPSALRDDVIATALPAA